jgi:hypothetical protein
MIIPIGISIIITIGISIITIGISIIIAIGISIIITNGISINISFFILRFGCHLLDHVCASGIADVHGSVFNGMSLLQLCVRVDCWCCSMGTLLQ